MSKVGRKKMRFKALSNKGKIRSANEDNYFVDEDIKFYMVADGMGGHAAGEVASNIAVSVAEEFQFNLSSPLDSLKNLVYDINQQIISESQKNPDYRGMGTTFAAALLKENKIYYLNLGDSRIYLYSEAENKLEKISKDHSLVANLLRQGKITEEEAFEHPKKNIVTQALGLDENLDLDTGQIDIFDNNYLLLCTDGLTDMIRSDSLKSVFDNYDDISKIADQLLEEALANGGADNITLIVADLDEN